MIIIYFLQPLSKTEESEVLELYFNGDIYEKEEARKKLILHNLRLVGYIVKKFYDYNNASQDELISIGIIGLIKGINTFSSEKNTKLSTYCSRCIENEILMFIRSNKKHIYDISLNEPMDVDFEGNAVSMEDKLTDEDSDTQEMAMNNIQISRINNLIYSELSNLERTVIVNRYGINCIPKTQHDIANMLNISRSYVSRIEKKALLKLRKFLE